MHIPFFAPTTPTSPSNLRRCEMKLKQASKDASGTLVALGESIMAEENQHYLDDTALPLVATSLPSVHFRVQKCYALLLTAAKTVSTFFKVMLNKIVKFEMNIILAF